MRKFKNRVRKLTRRAWAQRGDAPALGVIAVFFTVVFPKIVFGGKFVLAGDPLYYSYPLRSIGWEMIRGGQPPLWTPLVLSGYPLLSMSQLAFAYPLTWGYLFLPGHWAEHVYVLAPFLLSPAFTYAYARELGRSRLAALLAGLAFGYGGMMCSGISFAGYAPNSMLWLPLVLIPIDRAAAGRRGRFIPLLLGATAAYAMSVLNGQGQSFLYTGMVAAAYGLYISLFPREGDAQEEEDGGGGDTGDNGASGRVAWRGWGWRRRRWRPLFVALGALLMSVGIAAFQILETMRAARRSIRSTLSYEEISGGSFTLGEAVASLFAPLYHSTDVSAYVAPLALLLAVLTCMSLVARRSETRDARIYFWLGVAVVGWVLMLGGNTPLHKIVYHLPLLNKFRVPSRHTFEWTFAVSILAAYGWDIAARRLQRPGQGSPETGRRRRRLVIERIIIGLMLSLSVGVGFLWWRAVQVTPQFGTSIYTGLPESTFFRWKTIFTLCVLLLLWRGWRLVAAPRWRTSLLMISIALACVVEPAAAVSRWFEGMLLTAERFGVVSPTTRLLQNFPPEGNRVYTRVGLYSEEFTLTPRLEAPNLTAPHGIQNVAGYEPLIFERYSRALGGVGLDTVSPRAGYAHNNDLFAAKSSVLDLLNTTHVVSFSNLAPNIEQNISKDGISFAPSDAGITVAPGQTVTFAGGAVESDTLALVTVLSSSGELKQGAVVAKVRLHINGAPVIERPLRAGLDTAEWAHERADVRPNIQHALAPVFDSRPGDEGNSFSKHHYLARLSLGARVRIEKVEITNITPRSPLNLIKATLHDTASGSSTPLALAVSEWWDAVYQKDNALVMRNRRALPRAWLVAEAEAVDGEEALRRIRGESEHGFDPLRTALLEVAPAELPALVGGQLRPDSGARVVLYEPNRIVIETRAVQPTVLVVSEIIYPGWEATVDGAVARIHATNYLLRGVFVPAGEHRVEMRYRAPAARIGALISAFTLLFLSGLALYDWRTKRG